jgi:magnesium-transporting ATPase (P-type)
MPSSKFSSIDRKMNRVITFLFMLQLALCVVTAFLSQTWESKHVKATWYLGSQDESPTVEALKNFFVYFVLLSWIIPLSLFVSLEVVKVFQAMFMEWDIELALDPDDVEESGAKGSDILHTDPLTCVVRNNGLNDELSLVKYIFSDKTGTLTENEMKFQKCSIGGKVFTVKQLAQKLRGQDQGKIFEEIEDEEAQEEIKRKEQQKKSKDVKVMNICYVS